MAPVATNDKLSAVPQSPKDLKVFNPFYSPSIGDNGDDTYVHAQFKVRNAYRSQNPRLNELQPFFPKVSWPPLEDVQVTERGLLADPEKKSLLSAATKVKHYSPAIGTELSGIDLRRLSDSQKDELYVLNQQDGPDFTYSYTSF